MSTQIEPPARSHSRPDALYEVIDGREVELPEMGVYSALVATWIAGKLLDFCGEHRIGRVVVESLFVLDHERDLRRRPDLAFVSYERWPENRPISKSGDWEVIPDLAIEVISPHDTDREVHAKLREYFHYGVRQVWIVRPDDESIYVYRSPGDVRIVTVDQELDGGEFLPGFRFRLAPLFRSNFT